jgi:lysine 2,3-aminomutase
MIQHHGRPRCGVRYVHDIEDVTQLSAVDRTRLGVVTSRFPFRSNNYYLSLINWSDPEDPIRRIIVPHEGELEEWGRLDASAEACITPARGVQHKYPRTVLLLCHETCAGFCRYCFRKRLFMPGSDEVALDVSEGIAYIADHPDVTNVLLTGGDPLLLPTRQLESILESLDRFDHLRVIRIGSKMPAFNPWRILDDADLLNVIARYSQPRRRLYIMTHFDHPRELTAPAVQALALLSEAGAVLANQTPMIRGVNDDPDTLAELFRELAACGSPPYYVFQCRPTTGNWPYAVPLVEAFQSFDKARCAVSGLAKRARFVMSHETGKVEVLAVDDDRVYLRYHRALEPSEEGRFFSCRRDDGAYWLDDLVVTESAIPGQTS